MVDQVVTQQPPVHLPPTRGGNRRSNGFRFNKANHHGGGGDRRFPGRNNSNHQKSEEGQENNRPRERKDSGQKQIRPPKSILEELADQSFAHLKITPKARVVSSLSSRRFSYIALDFQDSRWPRVHDYRCSYSRR